MPYEYKPGNNDPLSHGGALFLGIMAGIQILVFLVWLWSKR